MIKRILLQELVFICKVISIIIYIENMHEQGLFYIENGKEVKNDGQREKNDT